MRSIRVHKDPFRWSDGVFEPRPKRCHGQKKMAKKTSANWRHVNVIDKLESLFAIFLLDNVTSLLIVTPSCFHRPTLVGPTL